MIRASRLLVLAAALCAVAVTGSQRTGAQEREFLLRFGLKAGQVLRYHGAISGTGQMTFEGQARPVVITGAFDVVHRIGREKNGAFEVTTRFENDRLTIQVAGEQEQTSRVGVPPVTRLMTALGKTVGEKAGERPAGAAGATLRAPLQRFSSRLAAVEFPEKPVKVGETWAQQPAAEKGAGGGVQTTAFEGLETAGGRECARLRTKATVPFDFDLPQDPVGTRVHAKGEQRIESAVLFDHERGQAVRQEATVTMRAETEARLSGVKEPVRASSELAARIVVELVEKQKPAGR